MNVIEETTEATLDSNGQLRLTHQSRLPPGPVRVTISATAAVGPRRGLADVLREIAAEQRTRGGGSVWEHCRLLIGPIGEPAFGSRVPQVPDRACRRLLERRAGHRDVQVLTGPGRYSLRRARRFPDASGEIVINQELEFVAVLVDHTLFGSTATTPGPKVASRLKWETLKVSRWLML